METVWQRCVLDESLDPGTIDRNLPRRCHVLELQRDVRTDPEHMRSQPRGDNSLSKREGELLTSAKLRHNGELHVTQGAILDLVGEAAALSPPVDERSHTRILFRPLIP
jgi:hypothetical protein